MIQRINTTRLEDHLQIIQGFGPHSTGSESYHLLKQYLYTELSIYGLSVIYHPWRYRLKTGENIEATLEGIGHTDGIVLLCAHYDSVVVSPGADDDGSGVAVVLHLAEIMSQYTFNSTIRFVLFSGEEQGLLGSHEYAKETAERGDNILGVINLDGVGYAVTSKDGNTIRSLADQASQWIVQITQYVGEIFESEIHLDIHPQPNQPIGDHQSFREFGYATNYFLEYSLNPYYHTSEDTLEHMNISYLSKVSKLTLGTLACMAELQRNIQDDDISIKIQGTLLSHPAQFSVEIQNHRFPLDTANITIDISLKNLFTSSYIPGPYNSTSHWVVNEEITDRWTFMVSNRRYQFECILFDVFIIGFDDDLGLYQRVTTKGVIFRQFVFIIPRC
jgi:hypothetical protein